MLSWARAASRTRFSLTNVATPTSFLPIHTFSPAFPASRALSQRSFCSAPEDVMNSERESMDFDVLIVGAGPAGLSAAIRLKQKCAEEGKDLSVCVVEKGASVGDHILSGNVFEPRALNELIPDWKDKGAPLNTKAKEDHFMFLTETGSYSVPSMLIPPMLHNEGNYIISLGQLCRWLAEQAEGLGVEIYPGFAAAELLMEDGAVAGVATRDVGIGKDGKPKPTFERGMALKAKQTLLAEGVRGSCSEEAIKQFDLRKDCDPQVYGLGVKEVWEIDPSKHQPGRIQHSLGWPLQSDTYGGSFMYHMEPNFLLVGFVVGLDYKNPYISPFEELQRFKSHPAIRPVFEGGKPVQYGARCINEGGAQAIPKLTFPGGALIGCSAGFVNLPKIKGTHTAMKSGMLAAESVFTALTAEGASAGLEVTNYEKELRDSWVHKELWQVRNVHPSFHKGLLPGVFFSGLETFLLKGREPFTWHTTKKDCETTGKAKDYKPIDYPKPDNKVTFDLLTQLALSGTNHEGNQPAHLRIKPELKHVPNEVSVTEYAGPEGRFCPARVYEYLPDDSDGGKLKLNINAQNCVHCKCCSIKSTQEFINWTVPEGGGGPAYTMM